MMNHRHKNHNLRWLWLSIFIIVLDQLTKYAARKYLSLMMIKQLVPGLSLYLTMNQGAAFSLLTHAGGWQRWFFSGFALMVSMVLIYLLQRLPAKQVLNACGLAFILGGALGNLCDRLVFGQVTDFVLLHVHSWSWPVFNLADSAVCVGAACLIYGVLRRP